MSLQLDFRLAYCWNRGACNYTCVCPWECVQGFILFVQVLTHAISSFAFQQMRALVFLWVYCEYGRFSCCIFWGKFDTEIYLHLKVLSVLPTHSLNLSFLYLPLTIFFSICSILSCLLPHIPFSFSPFKEPSPHTAIYNMCFDISSKHQQSPLISPIWLSCCYSSDISAFLWFHSLKQKGWPVCGHKCVWVCAFLIGRQWGYRQRLIWITGLLTCVFIFFGCEPAILMIKAAMTMIRLLCLCWFEFNCQSTTKSVLHRL